MHEQNLLEGKRPDEKVIVFANESPHIITQEDLAEERWLTIEAGHALKALERKRTILRTRLRNGWSVEEGLRSARLILSAESEYHVRRHATEKLIVR